MNRNIEKIFEKLNEPNLHGEYSCEQFNDSNLWILKDVKGNCGLLIDKAVGTENLGEYKNLEKKEIIEFESSERIFKDVLLIVHNDNVIPEVFSESLNVYFKKNLKKNYNVSDIKNALDEIEEITKKIKVNLNEIIGLWGEFFLIYLLLKNSKSEDSKQKIINAWESPDGRTIIDLKFKSIKINIEVKTTTLDSRVHHISSINQITNHLNWDGYLASICLIQGLGESCNDLRIKILNNLNDSLQKIFNQRILIRGKNICFDDRFKFEINNLKEIRFFNFKDVPKPDINSNTVNVKWDTVVEGVNSIGQKEFFKIFRL